MIDVIECELRNVVRQSEMSGILYNATAMRVHLASQEKGYPKIETSKDVKIVLGDELEDVLNSAYSKYGKENCLVVCRSNKRANLFNQQIRMRILWQENAISSGDMVMVVKNNYFWLKDNEITDFIANGDNIELRKIVSVKEMYGFTFADILYVLPDYPDLPEQQGMVLLDTLTSESPALTAEQQQTLLQNIAADYEEQASTKPKLFAMLKQNPHFNALQIKFSYAVTCHKAQGGQWPCVFIDQGYLTDEMINVEFTRWLYTAFTRATEQVYLINFSEKFFN